MKVIHFDECYTTSVGMATAQIKPNTVCGQFLNIKPNINIKKLIQQYNIKPQKHKSLYNHQDCYELGTLIPYEEYLLLAFAKLDEKGLGYFQSKDEYCKCLEKLWKEINKYYANHDVYVPVLGAGLTRINKGTEDALTKKEALNIMILSYKLSSYKLKDPYKLHIVCNYDNELFIDQLIC